MNIEITHELSRPGCKEKELSTFSSEMSLENFVDFTMDVSAGLDRLGLFYGGRSDIPKSRPLPLPRCPADGIRRHSHISSYGTYPAQNGPSPELHSRRESSLLRLLLFIQFCNQTAPESQHPVMDMLRQVMGLFFQ
jgi:hypothetical protein